MIILAVILGVVAWAACGILASGLYFGYFQREWPSLAKEGYAKDRREARFFAWFGPIALFVALLHCGTKHGLKFR